MDILSNYPARSGLFRADGMPLDSVREMLSETLPNGAETIPNLTDLFDHLEAASRQGTTLAGAETAASRQRGKQAVEMVEQYRREVAERMGVDPASISDERLAQAWEKDKNTPDPAEVDRWVESLGKERDEITATDLMTGVRKGFPLAMIKESVTRALEPENVPMDVGDGVTFSLGRQRTKGKSAMERVITDKVDAHDAMHRKGVGTVAFYYGEPGDPARDYKGGWGVSHIIARRTAEGADGSAIARRMVDTIAMGKIGKPYGPPGGERVNITLENDVAVLSKYKDGEQETWLLTGWEQEKTADATGRGNGLSGATLAGPMRTRPGKGATALSEPNIPPLAEGSQSAPALPQILAAKGARAVEAAGRDQKLAAAVGDTLGLSVVFYEQEGGDIINGMADADGRTVYLNAAGTRPVMWILAHETVHQLRRTNPEAYQKLRWIAKQHMTKRAPDYLKRVRDSYREEGIEKDAKALEEELIADYAGDKMLDPDFVKMLARRNPTLARRVIATLRSIVNRVQKALKGEDAAGFLRDAVAMQNALADALGAMGKEYRVAGPEDAGGVTLARGQREQTRTPEFKTWFGDWETDPANASKVVDANGEPLVVFHGTNEDFTSFGEQKTAVGYFFASEADAAAFYATKRGNVMPVYLQMKTPLRLDQYVEDGYMDKRALEALLNRLDMTQEEFTEWAGSGDLYAHNIGRTQDSLMYAAASLGYDGVIFPDARGGGGVATSYVAFSPTQIKSATGNRGTFDAENPDITMSMAAEQSGWWRGKDAKSVKGAARNLFRETTRHAVRTDRGKLEKLREDVEAMRGERRKGKAATPPFWPISSRAANCVRYMSSTNPLIRCVG